MKTNSILLVGSYVVPLATILVFLIAYFIRYKKYLLHKNSYKDPQFLGDCWKGYIFARLWQEQCRTGFKLWWYLFGSKYIDMVNFYSERCIYELDQLDRFEESDDNRPFLHRKVFMRHWSIIYNMLFEIDRNYNPKFKDDYAYKFDSRFGDDPFGWMTVMIESKMFELYKKHSLLLLRTKGYREFSGFLAKNYNKSKKYPHNAPFSIIASGSFHERIMWDHSVEIGERLQHEVKVILGTSKVIQEESHAKELQLLLESFVVRGSNFGGGYSGTYYTGLSDVRREIFELLEKTKVTE